MARKVGVTEAVVEVHVRRPGDFGWMSVSDRESADSRTSHYTEEADRIRSEVLRHVDCDGASVSLVYGTYCSQDDVYPVEDGNQLGQWPECCTEDQQEFYNTYADKPDQWFYDHGMDDPDFLDEFREADDTKEN